MPDFKNRFKYKDTTIIGSFHIGSDGSQKTFIHYPSPKALEEAIKKEKEKEHHLAYYDKELYFLDKKIRDKKLYPNRDYLWHYLIHLCVRMWNDECYPDREKRVIELAKKLMATF